MCEKIRHERFNALAGEEISGGAMVGGWGIPTSRPFVCLSVCLFVCLSVCLFVCLSVCLFVCLSVCLFVPVATVCNVSRSVVLDCELLLLRKW